MSEVINENPVNFTPSALKEIRNIRENEAADKALRIGVKNGGCAGFSYIFEFDNQKSDDLIFQIENIPIIIDKMHLLHLKNIEIDFENGLNNRGFTFTNPNASSTCGCGTSFG